MCWFSELSKQLILSPTEIFRTDANHIFSNAPSLTHTLSLSLRMLALFPFFLLQYKNDDVAQVQIIKNLTINVCGPKSKLSHFHTLYTIIYNSAKNTFLLFQTKVGMEIDLISIMICDTFSVVPSMISNNPGNTKGGSIIVPLTSCLTGLDQSVLQI